MDHTADGSPESRPPVGVVLAVLTFCSLGAFSIISMIADACLHRHWTLDFVTPLSLLLALKLLRRRESARKACVGFSVLAAFLGIFPFAMRVMGTKVPLPGSDALIVALFCVAVASLVIWGLRTSAAKAWFLTSDDSPDAVRWFFPLLTLSTLIAATQVIHVEMARRNWENLYQVKTRFHFKKASDKTLVTTGVGMSEKAPDPLFSRDGTPNTCLNYTYISGEGREITVEATGFSSLPVSILAYAEKMKPISYTITRDTPGDVDFFFEPMESSP